MNCSYPNLDLVLMTFVASCGTERVKNVLNLFFMIGKVCVINIIISEEDIDGQTLINLTESMIAKLAPTTKKQGQLIGAICKIKQPTPTSPSVPSSLPSCSSLVATPPPTPIDDTDKMQETQSSAVAYRKTMHGQWPISYRLPDFSPTVAASLARKDPRLLAQHKSSAKSALVNSLFDQITK